MKKITQAISKVINLSFEFGVLQRSRYKQNTPTESWIFQVLEKYCGMINVKFKCWFAL